MVRFFAHSNRYDRRTSRAFGGLHAAADWPTPAVPSEHNPARDRPHRPAPSGVLGRLVIENPA
jgi:hypothetical protein